VVSELIRDKYSILLQQSKKIGDFGGSFDYENKEFIVSMQNKMGFEIFIHEYCHYLQWKTDRKYFMKLINNCGIVFDWLDGKFFRKDIIEYAIRGVIELEWDCEKRALDQIKQYKLDVDVEEYCKSSNSYLLFYNIVHQERKWYKETPYTTTLVKSMPDKLMDLEFYLDKDNITEKQYKQYLKLI
jgi:hypothetical protein